MAGFSTNIVRVPSSCFISLFVPILSLFFPHYNLTSKNKSKHTFCSKAPLGSISLEQTSPEIENILSYRLDKTNK